jgi:hypothetical protein
MSTTTEDTAVADPRLVQLMLVSKPRVLLQGPHRHGLDNEPGENVGTTVTTTVVNQAHQMKTAMHLWR